MSRLYISEYATATPTEPRLASQVVEFEDVSVASRPFHEMTILVCLHADEACSVKFGQVVVATPDDWRMAPDSDLIRAVKPGLRVAVIANAK